MPMDDGLFDLPDLPEPAADAPQHSETVADWQVAQLRGALDALGMADMSERQKMIERLVGRPVSSLRDLTWSEARSLGEHIAAQKLATRDSKTGSAWDDRDEDTWIDRL